MISQTLMSASESLIGVDAADFDGTNDFMKRGAGFTGAADSKIGILSYWLKISNADGDNLYMMAAATTAGAAVNRFKAYRSGSNFLTVQGYNSAGTSILNIRSTTTYTSGATWRHFLASWDLTDTAKRFIYVNDVADLTAVTYTNDTIDYTLGDWGSGGDPAGNGKLNGYLAELYFAPGQYLDFSVLANRRKFISITGKPVFLGTDGSVPTGTAPLVYQHLDDAEAAADFATNRGTGGNFSITGTLATASTSPSD